MSDASSTDPFHKDDLARIIVLAYGPMESGKGAYWCYVAVRPSQYDRFQQVKKSGQLNLYKFEEDGFGEIVVSGEGVSPPQDVTYRVAKMFNLDIKDLFSDKDPQALIEAKIAQMKQDGE